MKLSLAPLQGNTVAPYRNLHSQLFGGIDDYYSPFISTNNILKINRSLFKDLFPENNNKDINLIPQMLGNSGSDFNRFAEIINDYGYDEINWNIGCPFHTVTKKNKGSGILPHTDMIIKFLDEVCSDKNYDLTVKMRLGLTDLSEGIEVVNILNDYPIKDVIIHSRTGAQKYEGNVDLDGFETLLNLSKHNVVYNGDIFSLEDFNNIQSRFPMLDDFMLARGVLWNPFLPAEIKGIDLSSKDKIQIIEKLHQGMFAYYQSSLSGDKHLCDKMKEFWSYLSVNMENSDKIMKKIKKCTSTKNYLDIVDKMIFNSVST